MNFDSSIKSPINDALDILINLNPKHFATLNDPIKLQKYRNQFLGEQIEETRSKIKNGTYKLKDLNKSK